MLTKFCAALLATSLVAGSALAAQPSGNSDSMHAAQTTQAANPAKTATTHKTLKTAKRQSTRGHKHFASGQSRMLRHARHNTPAKTHQADIAKSAKHS
jgi:Ni/Co efflux regulator RcnB